MFYKIILLLAFGLAIQDSNAQSCNCPSAPAICVKDLVADFGSYAVGNDYTEAFKQAANCINQRGGYFKLTIPYSATPYRVGKIANLPSDPNNYYQVLGIYNCNSVEIDGSPNASNNALPQIKLINGAKIGSFDPVTGLPPGPGSQPPSTSGIGGAGFPTGSLLNLPPGFERDNVTGNLLCPWYHDANGNLIRDIVAPLIPFNTNNIWNADMYVYVGTYHSDTSPTPLQLFFESNYFLFDKYGMGPGRIFYFYRCHDITLKNLILDGNKENLSLGGTYGASQFAYERDAINIFFDETKNITLDNMILQNAAEDNMYARDIFSTSDHTNMHVSNSVFRYSGRNTMSFTGGNYSDFTNCQFSSGGRINPDNPPASPTAPANLIVTNPAGGISLEAEYSKVENITFTNCVAEKNAGNQLMASYGNEKNDVFTNCTFKAGDGFCAVTGSSNDTYTACHFYGGVFDQPPASTAPYLPRTYTNCTFGECDGNTKYPLALPFLYGYTGSGVPPVLNNCSFESFSAMPLYLERRATDRTSLINCQVVYSPRTLNPAFGQQASYIYATDVSGTSFTYPPGFSVNGFADLADSRDINFNILNLHPACASGNSNCNNSSAPVHQPVQACEGAAFQFPLNTFNIETNTANSFSWTGPNNFTSTQPHLTISNFSSANTGTYICTISNNSCVIATYYFDVTMKNKPPLTVSSNSPVCLGGTLNLFANSTAGATYTWTWANNLPDFISHDQNPVIVTNGLSQSGGLYTCTATYNGCSNTQQLAAPVAVVGPVNGLRLTGMTITGVSLTWNTIPYSGVNYTLAYKLVSERGWHYITGITASQLPYSLTGLTLNQTYIWKIITTYTGCPDTESQSSVFIYGYCTYPDNSVISTPLSNATTISVPQTITLTGNINVAQGNLITVNAGLVINLDPNAVITTTNTYAEFDANIQPCILGEESLTGRQPPFAKADDKVVDDKTIAGKVVFYPNPTKDYLNVQSTNTKIKTVTIMNGAMQVVYRKDQNNQSKLKIPVQMLSNGIYIIELETSDNKKVITKFIKL